MTTGALLMMIGVQAFITAVTLFYFFKVLIPKKRTKEEETE